MKKFIIVLLLLICIIPLYAETRYTVETNSGTQEVIIPDDMTELDVLLYLAQSYYNLYDDYELLQSKTEALTETIKSYVDDNKNLRIQYNDLISKYNKLVTSYKSLNNALNYRGLIGGNIDFANNFTLDGISLNCGILLFQKLGVLTRLGVTIRNGYYITYGLGILLTF